MYGIFELSLSYFIVVMRNDHLKEETENNVNLGRDEKHWGSKRKRKRPKTMSTLEGTKNIGGRRGRGGDRKKCQPWKGRKKLKVDPPPSPTTPASYGQFFFVVFIEV